VADLSFKTLSKHREWLRKISADWRRLADSFSLFRLVRVRRFDSILFGSKARGDSEPDSDIDILLIVDQEDWHFRHQISDIASGIALEHGVLIGSFIIAKDRWEMMKRERFSLYENVAREGIPLLLGTD